MASISGNTAQAFHAEWTREPVTLSVALRAALAQEESEYGLAQQVKAVCLAHPHWHVAFLNAIVYSYCEMISDNLLVPADTWGCRMVLIQQSKKWLVVSYQIKMMSKQLPGTS